MATEPTTKIDRRIVRSHAALEKALLELIEEKPYGDIAIADITERANVSRPTFYVHFKTKDELFLRYLDGMFDRYFREIRKYMAQPPSDVHLLKICEMLFIFWKRNLPTFQIMQRNNIEHLTLGRLEEYMRSVFDEFSDQQGMPLRPSQLDLVIDVMVGNLFMLVRRWTRAEEPLDYRTMGRIYFETINPVLQKVLFDRELDDILPQ